MSRSDDSHVPNDPAQRTKNESNNPNASATAPYLENYLDHVYARLVGTLPYAQRMEVRAELREHLLSLTEAKRGEGLSETEALSAALKQFGSPRRLAREWKRRKRSTHSEAPAWSLKRSVGFAVAVFMGVTLLSLPLLLPPFLGYFDPAHAVGLGYADWWALLLPLVAGGVIGYYGRGRSYAVSFYALSLTILLCAIPYLGNFPSSESYGGFSSIYELFCILYGLYGFPLTFIGIALGRGMARLNGHLPGWPTRYRRMSLT